MVMAIASTYAEGAMWFAGETFGNMVVVTLGVAIASYGELNFHVLGVMLQLLSVCTESTRLTLVQILLQRRGLSLNPITTVQSDSRTGAFPAPVTSLLWPDVMAGRVCATKDSWTCATEKCSSIARHCVRRA